MEIRWPENISAFTLADGRPVYGVGFGPIDITLTLQKDGAQYQKPIVARDNNGVWADWLQPADVQAIEAYAASSRFPERAPLTASTTEGLQSTFRALIEERLDALLPVQEKLEGMLRMNLLPEAGAIKTGIVRVLNDAKKLKEQGGTATCALLREDVQNMLERAFGIVGDKIDTIDDGVSNEARELVEHLLTITSFSDDTPSERARIERGLTMVLQSAFGLAKKSPNIGDRFDPRTMEASSTVETTRDDEHETVETVVADGYGYTPGMARVLEERIAAANGMNERSKLLSLKSSDHVVKPKVRVLVKK